MFSLEPPESLIMSQKLLREPKICNDDSESQTFGDTSNDVTISFDAQNCREKMKNKIPANFVPKEKNDLQDYNIVALKKFGLTLGLTLKGKRHEFENEIMQYFSAKEVKNESPKVRDFVELENKII